jgi:hypothetical protein
VQHPANYIQTDSAPIQHWGEPDIRLTKKKLKNENKYSQTENAAEKADVPAVILINWVHVLLKPTLKNPAKIHEHRSGMK